MNKDELFLTLCRETARVPLGGYEPKLYSIPRLARDSGVSKYRIRQLIKKLEADGMVRKTFEGGIDDEGFPWCIHGWGLTKKACDTDLYKQCDKEASEYADNWLRELG